MTIDTIHAIRLVLTPLRAGDAAAMSGVLDDERLHEFIGGEPLSAAELAARYERLAAGSGRPDEVWLNWIVRLDGAPIGTVQATVTADHAEIAWVVGVPWQGHGYAGEAARALVAWLHGQGVRTISANIHPDHAASGAVAARAGLSRTDELVDGEHVWRTGERVAGVGQTVADDRSPEQ